jgi:hypothetical protein
VAGGPTLGVLAADVRQTTDVHTLVADTGPVSRAVGVTHTLKRHTANTGVALGSSRAGAHRDVVGGNTDSVSTTRPGNLAWVLTLSIVTGSCGRTIRVGKALVRGTAPTRAIHHCARRALALVCTHSVHANGCWLTGAVLTLVNVHALVDREEETRLTLALRHMILAGACALATIDNAAGINATVIGHLAHLVLCAVVIFLAFHLCAPKRRAWIAHMLIKAPTQCLVLLHFTVSIGPALGPFAGVDTLPKATLHHTREAGPTIPVCGALIGAFATFHKGIAHQARRTEALEGTRNIGAGS